MACRLDTKEFVHCWYQHCCIQAQSPGTALLRIKIVRHPPPTSSDGIRLDRFEPGHLYEVGSLLGALMLAEGWAEPVDDQPESFAPLIDTTSADGIETKPPPNLIREVYPPYVDRLGIAADFERRKKPR
jgi:hypothetical protein